MALSVFFSTATALGIYFVLRQSVLEPRAR
jgi:hypothetical protein